MYGHNMSKHLSMSPDKKKASLWHTVVCFSIWVYFGLEGLLQTLPAASNCFITLRSVLIGTSKVAYFARCQSLACVTVQRAHNSSAEWRRIEGGVNDLTEDSVEPTPAHGTNHLLLSSTALEQKTKKKDKERTRYKMCGCRMQQLSYT